MHRRVRGFGAWRSGMASVAICLSFSCTIPNPEFVSVDGGEPGDTAPLAEAGRDSGPKASDTMVAPQTWLTPGLVGYWRFEERSGVVARDSSGFGHDGTLENMGMAPWVPGHVGTGALDFPGSARAGVRIQATPVLDAIRGFTIAAWVKRGWQSGSTHHSVLSRQLDAGNNELFNLSCLQGDAVIYTPRNSRNQIVQARAALTAVAGEWLHLAGTYDGSVLLLYQNGAEIARTSGLSVQLTGSVTDIFIGTNQNSTWNEPFLGAIDEVLLFSMALSPQSIKVLADRGSPIGLR